MHPFVLVVFFGFILGLLNSIHSWQLICLSGLLIGLASLSRGMRFWRSLKHMRWFFVSILGIYAYTTAGEYVPHIPLQFAPSYEGLTSGATQIGRLLGTLAAIQLLFASLPKQTLMSGLYTLLYPLQLLGFNVRQFSARLLLTLRYAETLAGQSPRRVLQALHDEHDLIDLGFEIDFVPSALAMRDYAALMLMLLGASVWFLV